jgi:hypothetical protein
MFTAPPANDAAAPNTSAVAIVIEACFFGENLQTGHVKVCRFPSACCNTSSYNAARRRKKIEQLGGQAVVVALDITLTTRSARIVEAWPRCWVAECRCQSSVCVGGWVGVGVGAER